MSIESEEETARSSDSKDAIRTYDKEKMMMLRETTFCRTRPMYLGFDFDGDDGKFSPYKWLQHKWEEDGVKDRPMTRKDEIMKEDGESTVLSPQRRAFSGGCRAPQDKSGDHENDAKGRANWRQGATGGGVQKTDFNNKFKRDQREFDRKGPNGSSGSSSWRNDRFGSGDVRQDKKDWKGNDRDKRGRREDDRPEKLPEWADGPTSINDVIELKGFDEPKKRDTKKGKSNERKNGETGNRSASGSRPSSNPSASISKRIPTPPSLAGNSALPTSTSPTQSTSYLKSDEEFAKYLGLIDNTSDSRGITNDLLSDILSSGVQEESQAATGSRLSRFFKSRATEGDHPGTRQPLMTLTSDSQLGKNNGNVVVHTDGGESLLSRFFDNSSKQKEAPAETPSAANIRPGPVTLEDLEKNIRSRQNIEAPPYPDQHSSIGNICQPNGAVHPKGLEDPREQATLLSKLQRMAKEQEAPQMRAPPSVPQIPVMPGNFAHPTHVAHVIAQSQYNAAMMQAAAALQGPVPPHIQERIRQAAVSNLVQTEAVLQTRMAAAQAAGIPPQTVVTAFMQQAMQQSQLKRPSPAPPPPAPAAPIAPPTATALIPASVQKKAATSFSATGVAAADKGEKSAYELEMEKAEIQKRSMMQHQYAAMLSAMQGGLSMNAWRGSSSAHSDAIRAAMVETARGMLSSPSGAPPEAHVAAMAFAAQQQALQKTMSLKKIAAQQGAMQSAPGFSRLPQGHPSQSVPARSSEEFSSAPMQNPLEKLLAAAGVQPKELRGREDLLRSTQLSAPRPISLEELERTLMDSK